MSDYLRDGYPTKRTLKIIREYQVLEKRDYHDLMEIVAECVAHYGGCERNGELYEVWTGGWSGNEDVITALQQNALFWILYWKSSRRGGHYVFEPVSLGAD